MTTQATTKAPQGSVAALRVALLEDDQAYGELLSGWLTAAGHVCHWEQLAAPFLRLLSRETYDVCVIDWRIPDRSGEEVLVWLRANLGYPLPVIFVTSRDSEEDIAHILDRGADDYLAKPIRKLEFLARVRALARRTQALPERDVIEVGNMRLDPRREAAWLNGAPVALAPKEFSLMLLLLRNLGRLLSRGQIFEAVWGRPAGASLRTVDTHVSQLRVKLGLTVEHGWRLSAIYQHGYRLEYVGGEGAGTGEASASS